MYQLVRQPITRVLVGKKYVKFPVYLSVIVAINSKTLYFCTPICKTM